MDLDTWQAALRRDFGRVQRFRWKKLGTEPLFSEYRVANPQKGTQYRVAIRGLSRGDNFCSCPDLATNALGTCKHVEFVLAKLARRPGSKKYLKLVGIRRFRKCIYTMMRNVNYAGGQLRRARRMCKR